MAHFQAVNDPPSYLGAVVPSDLPSELPAYTPRHFTAVHASTLGPREERIKPFEYVIKKNGKKMASMTLLAERALSKNIPTYLQGYPVKGRVYLRADKMDAVRLITVIIEGNIISGADPNKQQTFMKVNQVVWSAVDGAPSETVHQQNSSNMALDPSTTSSDATSSSGRENNLRHDISHKGYSWDFSVRVPNEVAVPYGPKKQMGLFSPPETFTEQLAHASVVYQISVRYSRGKWQNDYRIPVPFGYVPLTRPRPFSPLRQLSYHENAPLLGPTVDVEGWLRVKQETLKGTLFSERDIEMKCTLFLAKPLAYTRGSLIPLSLCIEGEDEQGFDLLSNPKFIDIRLQRRVQYHYDPIHTVGTNYLRDSVSFLGCAVLWPSNEEVHGSQNHIQFLNGEIHIKPGTMPTCAMGDFRVEYNVILLACDTPGFEPLKRKPLITQPVDVVSLHAPGPRPRKYAPPGYEVPESRNLFFLE